MVIHGSIIFRNLFKEINMIFDIREYFDSCLHHSSYLMEIQILCDDFFDVWKCHFIELLIIHLLHVFPIHPAKLHHVKYRR